MLDWDSLFKIIGESGFLLGDLGQEFIFVKSSEIQSLS